MKARDVMVSPVITVTPSTGVHDVARLFLDHHISAVPVVDGKGALCGIVTEGDLMRRVESGTERQHSAWMRLVLGDAALATEYAKAHSRMVSDIMTKNVVTATPETPLREIANLFEKHAIKRVPIVRANEPIGIVSRANLVQAVASGSKTVEIPPSDDVIRKRLLSQLREQPWAHTWQLNVTVHEGIVNLWGMTYSEAERQAARIAAENIPGVRAVNNNLALPARGTMFGPTY